MAGQDLYHAQKQYSCIILHQLKSDPALYKELQPEIPILQAYNHIRAEEYEDAIPYLEEALALREVPNRRKARLAFVLGQLYSIQKNDVAAYDAFEKVSKLSPNYELEFFAKLNSAQKGMAAGKKSKDQLLDELKRLTKDDKNTDYGTAILSYHGIGDPGRWSAGSSQRIPGNRTFPWRQRYSKNGELLSPRNFIQ
ncbi:MAG: tetratricopeptide repeat protein [Saprospiraceae bacterium]|nr:tetratricopeptide repeat protein [Saprospiraceae bacterium]